MNAETKEIIDNMITFKSLMLFDALREDESRSKSQAELYIQWSDKLKESNEHASVLIPMIGEIAWINATIATRVLNNDYEEIDELRQRLEICEAMLDEGVLILGL